MAVSSNYGIFLYAHHIGMPVMRSVLASMFMFFSFALHSQVKAKYPLYLKRDSVLSIVLGKKGNKSFSPTKEQVSNIETYLTAIMDSILSISNAAFFYVDSRTVLRTYKRQYTGILNKNNQEVLYIVFISPAMTSYIDWTKEINSESGAGLYYVAFNLATKRFDNNVFESK